MAIDRHPIRAEQTTSNPLAPLLDQVGMEDTALVGGKAASLGEMIQAGIPVPAGFVVSAQLFWEFFRNNRLFEIVEGLLAGLNLNDTASLEERAAQLRQIILCSPMPEEFRQIIGDAYKRLGCGRVAVRSSATGEDSLAASFAGQHRTFLGVGREEDVISAVQACWASLFETRAIFYRGDRGFSHDAVAMPVVVQRMVPADISGVLFTADPSTGNRDDLLIEAIYGLGEPLVSGELSPDSYLVDKGRLQITSRQVSPQSWALFQNQNGYVCEHGTGRFPIPSSRQMLQKLGDQQIIDLARLGLQIERHYGCPQDIEWAQAEGEIYILQSRPVTTLKGPPQNQSGDHLTLTPLISGTPASPGVGAGQVRIVRNAGDIHLVEPRDVLVTEMTTPDFVPAMKRAAAIVTDRGGRTCHASIISREMGVPCVVGTGNATQVLQAFPAVTVDGNKGQVYEGTMAASMLASPALPQTTIKLTTRTRLYVNLADPEAAERVAALDVDGVGLLRAEFIMAHIGEHPRAMLESGRGDEFVRRLAEGLECFARAFGPRPVVYRFSDFKTNEYRNLKGGEAHEAHEENPMLGYRGCARYLSEPDLFKLEVEAVKRVRERFPNLWVMLPFVRSVPELLAVKKLLQKHDLTAGPDFKLWMMLEVPSNVVLLEEFLNAGVDGVSIGSNDLTQLILGVDRDNERLASIFDERNPAVLRALEHVIRGCTARRVTASICGQAPSVYPELTRKLVSWGITSISVSPDMIQQTRTIIHDAETEANG